MTPGTFYAGAAIRNTRPGSAGILARSSVARLHGRVFLNAALVACLFALTAAVVADAATPQAQQRPPLRLTLKRAVELALQPEGNARIQLAEEFIRQAEARSGQARAALLPDLSAQLSHQNLTRNLAAFGIRLEAPIPGFRFPTLVGPFNVFDTRGAVTQNIFDLSSIRRFQASRAVVRGAREESSATRDSVAEQVARAYLAGLRADASLQAARANHELAEALLKLARDQKTAGAGTGIEVTRAQVQLANEQQRLLLAENEHAAARLRLLKALGLRLDTQVELTDELRYEAAPVADPAQLLETALSSRFDWKAQQLREQSARLSHSAAAMERLPSLAAFADYGSIGTGPHEAIPTRTYGVTLRVPLFDGGRRDARRAESGSLLRQEQVRARDLREQIELEVRLAVDRLKSAELQVNAASEGLALAENELAQARRRYEAGVASGLEVTDAQARLERARENRINALFGHNLARIELAAATGTIRALVQ